MACRVRGHGRRPPRIILDHDTTTPSPLSLGLGEMDHGQRRGPFPPGRVYPSAGCTPQHCGHTDSLREQLIDAPLIDVRSCPMEGVERSRVARGVRPGATPRSVPVTHHVVDSASRIALTDGSCGRLQRSKHGQAVDC